MKFKIIGLPEERQLWNALSLIERANHIRNLVLRTFAEGGDITSLNINDIRSNYQNTPKLSERGLLNLRNSIINKQNQQLPSELDYLNRQADRLREMSLYNMQNRTIGLDISHIATTLELEKFKANLEAEAEDIAKNHPEYVEGGDYQGLLEGIDLITLLVEDSKNGIPVWLDTGANCAATVTSNTGMRARDLTNDRDISDPQYYVTSNYLLEKNPERYGVTKIPLNGKDWDLVALVGDYIQSVDMDGVPHHLTLYVGNSEEGDSWNRIHPYGKEWPEEWGEKPIAGWPLVSYSRGSYSSEDLKKGVYYDFVDGDRQPNIYRIVGTPKDLQKWREDYLILYPKWSNGGTLIHQFQDGGETEGEHPIIEDWLRNSGGEGSIFKAGLNYLTNKLVGTGNNYNGSFAIGKDMNTMGKEAIGRDLVGLYVNGNTTGFKEIPNAAPITVNGNVLDGKLYVGNILPYKNITLRPESKKAILELIANLKLLPINTSFFGDPNIVSLSPNLSNYLGTLDDVNKADISFKLDANGNIYMDVFDRWDLVGDSTNPIGRVLEGIVTDKDKNTGPFILRLRVPITFSRDGYSDGKVLDKISYGEWSKLLGE